VTTGTLDREDGHPAGTARGRRPSTTRQDVARAGLDLFARQGFDETTVDEIAAAVGVSRRTFFRYFDSKRDVVWGEFGVELGRLHALLAEAPTDRPMMDVLRWAVVTTNRFGDGELEELRTRIRLIGTVPSLIAHSAVMHDRWRTVVASFVAGRVGGSPEDLFPQTVAHAALGASMAAFNHWAAGSPEELTVEVDRALRLLAGGLGEESSGLV
jgi:TetR/AcrR family transcriptional regulator, regulator of mycofactocin system